MISEIRPGIEAMSSREIETWIAAQLASRLRVGEGAIDRDGPISRLGLDSVDAMEMLGDIEERFGVRLDAEALFDGEPTLAELAMRLASSRGRAPRPSHSVRPAKPVAGRAPGRRAEPSSRRDARPHPFVEYVNPHLGAMLEKLDLAKSFARGEGCYLFDREGRRYLDFIAQYGALPFGFNAKAIWDAVTAVREAGEPSFVQPSFLDAAGELARRLVAAAPAGLGIVTFSNSGAEAIEAAIKLSRAATGRLGVLTTSGSFHGKTLGALSATGNPKYQEGFGAPVAHFDSLPFGDDRALEEAFARKPGYYAALILEPIQGEGGIVEPPPGYLLRAQELARDSGTLLVVDEIQTGLGRTGAMFACESEGLSPDIMTLAKALGGGLMPIGATLCRREIYSQAFATKHSSTFAGNTLACRVGLAALDLLEENDRALILQVAENGARLKAELLSLQARFPEIVTSVRGRGYMLGVELSADRKTWSSSLLGYAAEQDLLAPLVASYLLNVEGVRTAPTLNGSNVLRIEPPLVATWKDCEWFLGAFERTLSTLAKGDTAEFIGHLVGYDGRSAPASRSVRHVSSGRPRSFGAGKTASEGDGRFAFLMHPLDGASYKEFDPGLARLDRDQLRELGRRLVGELSPMSVGEAVVESRAGARASGEFIVVPHDAEELLSRSPEDVLGTIETAARSALARGAGIVGLGGFLSIVTCGGLYLRNRGLPAITTGNSYTVVAAEHAIRETCESRGVQPGGATLAVVGASGAIGRATSIRLASEFSRLILIGNPENAERSRRRLLEVASDVLFHLFRAKPGAESPEGGLLDRLEPLRRLLPRDASRAELMARVRETGAMEDAIVITTNAGDWLPTAEVVVTATSSVDRLIAPENLRSGAIVCDLSRPSNVSEAVERTRSDVQVFAGGVVRLPADSDLGVRFGLDPGYVYACMAETMLLAIERRYQDTSVGLNLDLDTIEELKALSQRHGFEPCVRESEAELAAAI
jgi:acetylornithine/succinyldiaminopimelate/putrescine aminotransferase/predicted amino acid dehydrogenase/acyl carrier protein